MTPVLIMVLAVLVGVLVYFLWPKTKPVPTPVVVSPPVTPVANVVVPPTVPVSNVTVPPTSL